MPLDNYNFYYFRERLENRFCNWGYSLRVQGIPFPITREIPNAETAAALNEYYAMKAEKYKRYSSFIVLSNRFKKDLKLVHKRGAGLDDIADIVGYTVDTVKEWLGLLPA